MIYDDEILSQLGKMKVTALRELVEDLGLINSGFLEISDYVNAVLKEQARRK